MKGRPDNAGAPWNNRQGCEARGWQLRKHKKVTDPGKSEVCYQCVLCVFNKRRKVHIEIIYVTIFKTILVRLCEDCVKEV